MHLLPIFCAVVIGTTLVASCTSVPPQRRVEKATGNRYDFTLKMRPENGFVQAQGEIQISVAQPQKVVQFLLASGLKVRRAGGPQVAEFTQKKGGLSGDTLTLTLRTTAVPGRHIKLQLAYAGQVETLKLPQAIHSLGASWTEITEQMGIVPLLCAAPITQRSTYRLSIEVADSYDVVGSGKVQRAGRGGWTMQEQEAAHFALFIAPKFYFVQAPTSPNLEVQVVQTSVPDSTGRDLAALATRSAAFYNELFGPANRLAQLRVVVPPKQAMVLGKTWSYAVPGEKNGSVIRVEPGATREQMFYSVGHESAHHWWNFAPYRNTDYQSYLNEGFAEYSCLRFYRHEYGDAAFLQLIARYQVIAERLQPVPQMAADLPLKVRNQFTYIKTAYTLYLLENRIGQLAMQQLLRETLAAAPQSHETWLAVLERSAGKPARSYFEANF